jgi:hypothetical protein
METDGLFPADVQVDILEHWERFVGLVFLWESEEQAEWDPLERE